MGVSEVAGMQHRQRLLRALGVVPYVLRRGGDEPVSAVVSVAGSAVCVLVLPEACGRRESDLIERAMTRLGRGFQPAVRVSVADGQLSDEVPHVGLYLAFGEAQAQALGRALPGKVVEAAEVILLDSPEALFRPEAKRRLWQSTGHWRRTRHGARGAEG